MRTTFLSQQPSVTFTAAKGKPALDCFNSDGQRVLVEWIQVCRVPFGIWLPRQRLKAIARSLRELNVEIIENTAVHNDDEESRKEFLMHSVSTSGLLLATACERADASVFCLTLVGCKMPMFDFLNSLVPHLAEGQHTHYLVVGSTFQPDIPVGRVPLFRVDEFAADVADQREQHGSAPAPTGHVFSMFSALTANSNAGYVTYSFSRRCYEIDARVGDAQSGGNAHVHGATAYSGTFTHFVNGIAGSWDIAPNTNTYQSRRNSLAKVRNALSSLVSKKAFLMSCQFRARIEVKLTLDCHANDIVPLLIEVMAGVDCNGRRDTHYEIVSVGVEDIVALWETLIRVVGVPALQLGAYNNDMKELSFARLVTVLALAGIGAGKRGGHSLVNLLHKTSVYDCASPPRTAAELKDETVVHVTRATLEAIVHYRGPVRASVVPPASRPPPRPNQTLAMTPVVRGALIARITCELMNGDITTRASARGGGVSVTKRGSIQAGASTMHDLAVKVAELFGVNYSSRIDMRVNSVRARERERQQARRVAQANNRAAAMVARHQSPPPGEMNIPNQAAPLLVSQVIGAVCRCELENISVNLHCIQTPVAHIAADAASSLQHQSVSSFAEQKITRHTKSRYSAT